VEVSRLGRWLDPAISNVSDHHVVQHLHVGIQDFATAWIDDAWAD
jgi:hypothetical protein